MQSAGPGHAAGFPRRTRHGRCPPVTWLRRKSDRLRPLDEAAAYARCHGDRDESVRIVKLPPRRARYDTLLATGEDIRRSLEARIDGRDADSTPVVAP